MDGRSSTTGLDMPGPEFSEHFTEEHVPHSTRCTPGWTATAAYMVGPLARYALNRDRCRRWRARPRRGAWARPTCAATRSRASSCARSRLVHACDEALR
jgi:sulfhydrogenase subunit alpha